MIITTNDDKPEDDVSEDGADLTSVKFLIYSQRNYSVLSNIDIFCNLVYLDLSSNKLQSVDSVNSLRNLSFLNLEHNKISSLSGICDFPALESLNLANNFVSWRELERIRYMHIVQIQLCENPDLVKDQYYRQHVLDSLPNVWCLDGNFATSSERIRVLRFFQKSAFSMKPVRHKVKESAFIPTNMQNKRLRGVFGERTMKFLLSFPDKSILNAEWDKRKVSYLSQSVQYQLSFMAESVKLENSICNTHPEFLYELLTTRNLSPEHNDRFHIILMLLTGSSMFKIPQELFQECLVAFSLTNYGNVDVKKLFELPAQMKLSVLSVLMAAALIDYDGQNSPLYKELAIAMTLTLNCLYLKSNKSGDYTHFQSLLAAELTIQFGAIPEFYENLLNEDVLEFLAVATNNENFPVELINFARKKEIEVKGNVLDLYEVLDNFIGEAINANINDLITQGSITTSNAFLEPRALLKPEPRPLFSAPYLVKGLTPPNRSVSAKMLIKPPKQRSPNLGDEVLIGPQNIARILSLPEPKIALIQMPHVPLSNGGMCSVATNANDHYAYINIDALQWDKVNHRWHPKGALGDKVSIRLHQTDAKNDNKGDPTLLKSQPVTPSVKFRATSSNSSRSVSSLSTKVDEIRDIPSTPQKLYQPLSSRFNPKSTVFNKTIDIPGPIPVTPSSIHESAGRSSPEVDRNSAENESDKVNDISDPCVIMKTEQEDTENNEHLIKPSEPREDKQIINHHDNSVVSRKTPPQNLMVQKSFCVKCREKPRLVVRRINMNFPETQPLIFQTGPRLSTSGSFRFSISPEARYEAYLRDQQSKSSSRAASVLSRCTDSEKSMTSFSKHAYSRVPPSSAQSRVSYKLATKWLGDGKNLHSEEVLNQHLQQHIPRWKQTVLTSHYGNREQGTSRRALSAAYYSSLTCPQCQSSKSFRSANFSQIDFQNSLNYFEELDFYLNTPKIYKNTKTVPATPKDSPNSAPKSSLEIKSQELSFHL